MHGWTMARGGRSRVRDEDREDTLGGGLKHEDRQKLLLPKISAQK